MTEKEKMLAGMKFNCNDPNLLKELYACYDKCFQYNNILPSKIEERKCFLKEMLGGTGEELCIVQPFHCDFGKQIYLGERFFANYNLTILDEARVAIGDNCFIGPNVGIYTACHPINPMERNTEIEWSKPITIGKNVWIGGSVIILAGVIIGDNVTIGAGSVVVKDIPSNSIAVGNPCRVIKNLK